MKRGFIFFVTFVVILSLLNTAIADENMSLLDHALQKSGTMIVKEYTPCGSLIRGLQYSESTEIQIVKLSIVATDEVYYGLMLTHDNKTTTGLMLLDYDELEGIISTLEYIKEHADDYSDGWEVLYKTRTGQVIGGRRYTDDWGMKSNIIFVEFSSSNQWRGRLSDIDSYIENFKEAASTLEALII